MMQRGRLMVGVNRWVGRAWVAAGISLVVLTGGLSAVDASAANPEIVDGGAPQEPAVDPTATLTAPDLASAAIIARSEQAPVEAVGERTEVSSSWVLPDGSVRTALATGQVWVPADDGGDGTEAADWEPVDMRLEEAGDGSLRPAAAPLDVVVAGASTGQEWVNLVQVVDEEGVRHVLKWQGDLPTPRPEGPRAVYPEVRSGIDLVVEVRRTGVQHFLRVRTEPKDQAEVDALQEVLRGIDVTVQVDGAAAVPDEGGVAFVAGEEVLASVGEATVWDAVADSTREHPVAEEWTPNRAEMPVDGLPGSFAEVAGVIPADTPEPKQDASDDVKPPNETGVEEPAAESVAEVGTDTAEISVVPDDDFLLDDGTVFPVILDPVVDVVVTPQLDTYVQSNVSSTDYSTGTELRVGTYNSGGAVARSFLNVNVGQFAGRDIVAASLNLYNWHSWSCVGGGREWQVGATDRASASNRWSSQPYWWGTWGSSLETKGNTCAEGYVAADVRSLIQSWADSGAGDVAMGVKATSETNNEGWKKFSSAEGGAAPILLVTHNLAPATPSDFRISDSGETRDGNGVLWTRSPAPTFSVTGNDPDGDNLLADGQLWAGSALRGEKRLGWFPSGGRASWTSPEVGGPLVPYGNYQFRAIAHDGRGSSPWTPDQRVSYDPDPPNAPVVSSPDYPNDGRWHGDVGQAGAFFFSSRSTDVTHFLWNVDGPPDPAKRQSAVPAGDGTTGNGIFYAPTTQGRHTFQVVAVDRAGHQSSVVKYTFVVGRAGILLPEEGARVVSQARVAVGVGDSSLTHVTFVYRRGPGAPAAAVPSTHLRLPDGSAFPANGDWLAVSSLAGTCPAAGSWTQEQADFCTGTGGYAVWDAARTLGRGGGPVQIQALFATSASPGLFYAAQWVTVVVDTDVDGASTAPVGPGSVNLLTGDYTVGVTDVEEFGLSVGRVTSSRDPDSGYVLQRQLLSDNQRMVNTDTSGFGPGNAAISRQTIKGRTAAVVNGALVNDALQIVPAGGTNDTFAHLGGDGGAMRFAMQPLRRYRLSGSVFLDSPFTDTGDNARAYRMVAFFKVGGAFIEQASTRPSAMPKQQWVDQTLDITVPAGATEAFIRLYNGSAEISRPVYWDDLSLREVWAPMGPEWAPATSVDAVGTSYDRVTFPETGVAAVEVAGGGTIWFTASGDDTSRWYPMPGAEDLLLTKFDAATWRVTEIDGTVTDFRQRAGQSDWVVDTTSPPAEEGQARYVYQQVDTLAVPHRIIAPLEAGVDPAGCLTTPPAAGCEVLQFDYANVGTWAPTGQLGHLGALYKITGIRAFNGSLLGVGGTEVARYEYTAQGHLARVWDPRVGGAATGSAYSYDTAGAYSIGHLTGITPPGEVPWSFEYMPEGTQTTGGGDTISDLGGRLKKVRRQALQAALPGEAGYNMLDTSPTGWVESTMVYGVPLTRALGGPYDLDGPAITRWAQVEAPTDATAIFGPQAPPVTSNRATATVPGPAGYRQVEVHYLNASGAAVNTASPVGGLAALDPATRAQIETLGYIDTVDYDIFGNVIRSLDATNRLTALGVGPTAAADLNALGLSGLGPGTRALALSSVSTYSVDGLDVLRAIGPVQRLAIGNDPADVRVVRGITMSSYDEGKPDGQTYHLPTRETLGVVMAAWSATDALNTETLLDASSTVYGYSPTDGASGIGRTSGWFHRQATRIEVNAPIPGRDANGSPVTSVVVLDSRGRPVQSSAQAPGGVTTNPQTVTSVLYTAGANPADAACGNRPEWAGQPCSTRQQGSPVGHDPLRLPNDLPVKRVTDYTPWGDPTVVTESGGGLSRSVTTTYDTAGRVVTVAMSGSGAGMTGSTAAVSTVTTTYDPVTGDAVSQSSTGSGVGAGTVRTVRREIDLLGRLTKYDDGYGSVTSTRFDSRGRPVRNVETINGQNVWREFDYEPERGFLTGVRDAVAGTLTATYGPDGQVVSQGFPGGVTLTLGYDAARVPVSREYRSGSGSVLAASSVVENSAGQVVAAASSAGQAAYAYDGVGRLTAAGLRVAGASTCSWRGYAFADSPGTTSGQRGQRSSVAESRGVGAGCPTAAGLSASPAVGATAVGRTDYVYDSADRLVSSSVSDDLSAPVVSGRSLASSWRVDGLGRTTKAPVGTLARSAQGQGAAGVVDAAYFVNDLVSQVSVAGASRMSWGLDPLHRVSSVVREAWSGGAWVNASTTAYHFDADGDEPSWVHEEVTDPFAVSRYVEDPTGAVAVTTGSTTTGVASLGLLDVQGSVMATVPLVSPSGGSGNTSGSTPPSWVVDVPGLRLQAFSEFGAPVDLTSARAVVSPGTAGAKGAARYGWLGGAQRSVDALAGVVLMGSRVYDPSLGRFWQRDPIPGGNATTYDYCSGDPVNCTDLDGQWSLRGVLKGVAVVAEVAAFIPGPVGAAAGAVSAGAYLATGNKKKAAQMAVIAAANLVGAGAAVKAGMAAVRVGVKVGRVGGTAGRTGPRVTRSIRGTGKPGKCNSFAPGTPVLMADGTQAPIEDIIDGDLLLTTDPATGKQSANPVLGTITGDGTNHLLTLHLRSQTTGETSSLTVTVGHPLLATRPSPRRVGLAPSSVSHLILARSISLNEVNAFREPMGTPYGTWVQAGDLQTGDSLLALDGASTVVRVVDQGLAGGRIVYNLHVANVHGYHAGEQHVVAHNCQGVNWGQQEKHFRGHANFRVGGSELSADPRRLVRRQGTGQQLGAIRVLRPGSRERINFETRIGTYVSKDGVRRATTIGVLHYSRRGIHIVPGRPR